jgi:probable F420-dependent oxidoreductase
MDLGRTGLWTFQLDLQPADRMREAVAELEEMGWAAVWLPEAVGREPLVSAALVLGATRRMTVATGVASIWARDAMAMAAGQLTLAEAFPDRFLLGMGVSHQPMVDHLRGHRYERPLSTMTAYLDAMDSVFYVAPRPAEEPRRVLAALGPKMLALSAERTLGAHTYFVPVEHTAVAREALGEGPMLFVEQAVVLTSDREEAHAAARQHMRTYLRLPNYTNNLRRLGGGDDDLDGDGSDRLVDSIVAWGDLEQVTERVAAHHRAGADHVCVQVLDTDATALPMRQWRELAPALT